MIESLRIRGLGVIADAELRLHAGLTVLTGETGAGKTMVLTGLGLVLGDRADPTRVRPGAARTAAEGVVVLPAGSPVGQEVTGAGGSVDEDGTVVLVRTVSAEGRSRAHAGGTAVPAATLARIGAELVTVHGQADQRRLVQRAVQRELLDAYAGRVTGGSHTELVATHRGVHRRLGEVGSRLTALLAAAAERSREQDMLRHGLAEIADVDPRPGEDAELAAEQSRLGHAGDLSAAARAAHDVLAGGDDPGAGSSAAAALAGAGRALDEVAGLDPALTELADRVRAVGLEAADVATDLASYAGSVEDDPVRLAMIGDRRAALARLARRYGTAERTGPAGPDRELTDGADPVLAWADAAERRLLHLDGAGEEVQGLRAEHDRLAAELAATAAALSASRRRAASDLAAAVTAELADLAMPAARLSVQVLPRSAPPATPGPQPHGQPPVQPTGVGASGADDVVIGLQPHRGAGVAPLGSGASGGELSRVMLALEVVLAGTAGTPTYVFDEVDAGIGGRTALEVGRRLARLAATRQVVVVTHLAQVAAFADRHLVVVKDAAGEVTSSGVTEVSDTDRVAELARMLAGDGSSSVARAHAAELLLAARPGVPVG